MALVTLPRQYLADANGRPRVGAKAYFYQAGTTTEITVYQDPDFSTAHPNPVETTSAGIFPAIYVNPGVNPTYKIVITDADDVAIYTEDDIPAAGTIYPQTTAEANASVTPSNLSYPPGDIRRYGTNTTPGTTDMTEAIENAIAGAGRVVFQAETYSTNQIAVTTDCEIVLEPGTEIRARSGQAAGINVFNFSGGANVTLIGNGGLIAHDKTEYGNNGAESDHTIEILDATVYMENVRVADGGGDNVYVRHADADVTLVNVKAENAYRNNFSIVLCRRYVAIGCEGTDATGTNPQAGWDIEPNSGDTADLMYVRLIDCKTSGNANGGLKVFLHNAGAIDAVDIEISGFSSSGDGGSGFSLANHADLKGRIVVNDLLVHECSSNPIQIGSQAPADGLMIEINDPVLIDGNTSGSSSEVSQSFIAWSTSTGGERGNVTINSPTFIETRGVDAKMVYGVYMSNVDDVERVKIRNIRFSGISLANIIRVINGTEKSDLEITFAEEQRRAVTSNQNVGVSFLGQLITDEGDAGPTRIHTLLSNSPAGRKRFKFLNTTGNTLRLEPGATDSFRPLGGDGKYLQTTEIGAYIEIEYEPAIADWRVINSIGTWTVES